MRTFFFVLALLAAAPLYGTSASAPDKATRTLLGKIGVSRGVCVLLGDKDCARAIDLARASELLIYVQLADPHAATAARRAADKAGLYGTRIFVDAGPLTRIPLADDVADAVVAEKARAVRDASVVNEICRVLRPGGHDIIGGRVGTKLPPEGIDEWSHHYHGPDNNPQSRDRLARSPYLTQFVTGPRYAPAPQAVVAAGGRLFMAFGNVAWHEREEAWLNTLAVVNAYNGTLLWKRPLTPGFLVDRATMVATADTLFLADNVSCKRLDAATGEVRDEIVLPAGQADGPCWKWIALEGGILYGLVGEPDPPDPDARWKITNHGWPWNRISQGYNANEYAWGFAKTLFAFDVAKKQVLWRHREEEPIDSRSVCLSSGQLFISRFGRYLACLDAKTGSQVWRKTVDQDKDLFEAIGPYRPGHGYISGWKSTSYVKCTDRVLYLNGPQTSWLTAISAKDGSFLWKNPMKDLQVVIRDEGLYVIGSEQSSGQTKRLDPMTGAVLAELPTKRRACTRATGSSDSIFFRAFDGTTRLDIAAGQPRHIASMRPSCHVGVIVAHGHLYWTPWACDCNLQMFGTIALGPAGTFSFGKEAYGMERLETGPDGAVAAFTVLDADWPAYRANGMRTAATKAALPEKITLRWKEDGRSGIEPTAPVAAGGLAFVGGADGILRALGMDDGKARWTAYTGGALRFPPAVADGRAIVGSNDGWVYAFEAATGRLLWRFRAAPAERRIPVFGTLASTWPAAAPVVVEKGVVYAAAGMNALDGTHVYALEVASGRIVWQNNTSGHLDAEARSGVAVQGEMLIREGKLYLAGGNVVSPGVFDLADGKCLTPAPQGVVSGAPRGRELEVVGGDVVVSGQPFYSHPDFPVYDQRVKWREQRMRASNFDLVVVKDQNPAAGATWRLSAREKGTDAERWTVALPGEPVRWGIAVDAVGRIIVTLRDGSVACYGTMSE